MLKYFQENSKFFNGMYKCMWKNTFITPPPSPPKKKENTFL